MYVLAIMEFQIVDPVLQGGLNFVIWGNTLLYYMARQIWEISAFLAQLTLLFYQIEPWKNWPSFAFKSF